jgi:hypothetical protein
LRLGIDKPGDGRPRGSPERGPGHNVAARPPATASAGLPPVTGAGVGGPGAAAPGVGVIMDWIYSGSDNIDLE